MTFTKYFVILKVFWKSGQNCYICEFDQHQRRYKIYIQIEIPPHKIDQALKKGRASLRTKVVITAQESLQSKTTQTGKKIQKDFAQLALRFNQKEQAIIKAWNEHPYISGKIPRNFDNRNQPITNTEMTEEFCSVLTKTIRKVGSKRIIKAIDQYLLACSNGKHVWNQTNHGYKNLHGFLAKIYKLELSGQQAWWVNKQEVVKDIKEEQIKDKSPELTQFIANLYATYVLGTGSYELENPSKDYKNFFSIKRKILRRLNGKKDKVNIETVFSYLVEAATSAYSDSIIYPATLNSANLWNIVFPQYIKSRKYQ